MEKNIKKAFESAEQEVQEKEIAYLKSIIKDLLEKKAKKEDSKRDIEKEISIIKQTIDDFKAGRLDKVKELIEKDVKAKDILPFKIVIINQPVITKPWNWSYQIVPIQPYYTNNLTGWNGMTTICTAGTTSATYTTGTYSLSGGNIINI